MANVTKKCTCYMKLAEMPALPVWRKVLLAEVNSIGVLEFIFEGFES